MAKRRSSNGAWLGLACPGQLHRQETSIDDAFLREVPLVGGPAWLKERALVDQCLLVQSPIS